jgi:uncharacterized protein (TIGR02569 family)
MWRRNHVDRDTPCPYGSGVFADGPSSEVLQVFGVEGPARRLSGGQGSSWRVGDLVLKPEGGPVHEWLGRSLVNVVADGVRLSHPVPTRSEAWVCGEWAATRWVQGGEPDYSAALTWIEIIEAGRAFHRSVANLTCPDCLDTRTDRWAKADRVAWGQSSSHFLPQFLDLAGRLNSALEPLGDPQIVHADLTRNVLFAPGLAPAVIDISPYWRPPAYAEGVVVADALCWHDAPAGLLEQTGVSRAAVARALLFRMATTNEAVATGIEEVNLHDELRRYRHAAETIGL